MVSWDSVYTDHHMTMWEPHETVVQFVARFLKKRLTLDQNQVHRQVHRIFDLGCGNGAQSLFLNRCGYEVYGLDLSKEAVRFAQEYATREGLEATFISGDCEQVPFEAEFFDVAIAYGLLDHILMTKAQAAVQEVHRVLKPGGLFWLSLASVRTFLFAKGPRSDRHTYVLEEGDEEGEVQHYFDEEEVHDLLPLDHFRLLDIRHRLEDQYTISDMGSMFPRAYGGRWFITAEVVK